MNISPNEFNLGNGLKLYFQGPELLFEVWSNILWIQSTIWRSAPQNDLLDSKSIDPEFQNKNANLENATPEQKMKLKISRAHKKLGENEVHAVPDNKKVPFVKHARCLQCSKEVGVAFCSF
jgi:hypothetical protein